MIKNLQALRAFAAISVIFVHLDKLLGQMHLSTFGGTGVDLFFVISGFVMVYTTETKPPRPEAFMLNRIIRIVPIYWLATLSVFAIAVIAPSLLGATKANLPDLLRSLLFIPYRKANGLVEPVLFVGWSLNYEMFFYLLFTLGLSIRRYLLGLGLVAAILAFLTFIAFALQPKDLLTSFYANPIVLEFALGMGIALGVRRAPETAPLWLKRALLLTLCAAPVLLFENFIWPVFPGVWVSGILSMILVTGAVLLDRWGWSLNWRPALLVGDASYVLYLSHPYVTQTFQKLKLHVTPVILIPLCILLAIALAILIHKMVEKPLTAAFRRWTTRTASLPAGSKPA